MKNAAANTLNGGAGDDTFWELASSSTNIYVGGTGVNKIDYSLRVSSTLNILLDGKAHSGEANENDTIGTDFRDAVGGSSSTNFITGNSLANVLKGGPFSTSTLTGLDGDDTLYAIGADTLVGGNGDDTFILPATQLVANVSVDCGAGTGNTIDWSLNPTSTIIALGFGTTSTTDGSGFHVTIAGTADTCNNAVAGQGTSDPTGIPSTIFGNSLDNILDGNSSSVAGTWITGGAGVNICMNMQASSTYCQ
jgi:serralysin